MESLIQFITDNIENVHTIGFVLIMLGGINLPISEDLIMISAGMAVGTVAPEKAGYTFAWLFFACWLSAWEAYWIGRILGPRMYDVRWLNKIVNRCRIDKINRIYERFGSLVFFVGRFVPGGIRNCLFMTSGMGKMAFHKFILRDLFACLLAASFLFSTGYFLGQYHEKIIYYFKIYNTAALVAVISIIISLVLLKRGKAWAN